MKNKYQYWYIGYIIAFILFIILIITDLPKSFDIGIMILFSAVFGVSNTQIRHNKMIEKDIYYKNEVMDERNILIKEKAGNIANMVTLILLGIATVIFICFNFIFPAVITAMIIFIQPVILIIISNSIENKM